MKLRKLLLFLLFVWSGLSLPGQSALQPIYYYWIDADHLCLWKTPDAADGVVVSRSEGRWVLDRDVVRISEKAAGSVSDISSMLDRLSKERPADGWAKPRQPDVEIVTRLDDTQSPTGTLPSSEPEIAARSGTLTFISRIAHKEVSVGLHLSGTTWSKTGDIPFKILFASRTESEAALALGATTALKPQQWPEFWDNYVKAASQTENPGLNSYIDQDGKPRSVLRYIMAESVWVARRSAGACPVIPKEQPPPPAPATETNGWLVLGLILLVLVAFVAGVMLAGQTRNIFSSKAPASILPDLNPPVAPESPARTLSEHKIEVAADSAWEQVRPQFASALKRAISGAFVSEPVQAEPSMLSPSSWELFVRRLQMAKIPTLQPLIPRSATAQEWLEGLPQQLISIETTISDLTGKRGRELEEKRRKNELELTRLKEERATFKQSAEDWEYKFNLSRGNLERSEKDLVKVKALLEDLRREQKDASDEARQTIEQLNGTITTLKANLADAQLRASANEAAKERLTDLTARFQRIDNLARRLQEGQQQYFSKTGDVTTTDMISFLANHSLYKLAVGSVTGGRQESALASHMLINLDNVATKLQDYHGFNLAKQSLRSDFSIPSPSSEEHIRSAAERPEGGIFQFTLGYLRNSQRINLAPFYLDVDDQGRPYRAD